MDRDAYVDALKRKIDEWNGEIAKIESKVKQASDEAERRYETQLAEMRRHRDKAEAQMDKMIDASAENWKKHRQDFEQAWDDIATGFGRAWARFF